jgi:hypothetical protein
MPAGPKQVRDLFLAVAERPIAVSPPACRGPGGGKTTAALNLIE